MKRQFLTVVTFLGLCSTTSYAQDILPDQVPAPVKGAFNKAFPNAYDVEWERDATRFKVEFETGIIGTDHEVWYDEAGTQLRHREEIPKGDLPKAVTAKLDAEFGGFRVSDVERVSEKEKTVYTMELEKGIEEWKVTLGSDGSVISKVAD